MSKTNDTSKLGHAAPEGHRALGDTELDAVTGGTTASVGALGYTFSSLWGSRPALNETAK